MDVTRRAVLKLDEIPFAFFFDDGEDPAFFHGADQRRCQDRRFPYVGPVGRDLDLPASGRGGGLFRRGRLAFDHFLDGEGMDVTRRPVLKLDEIPFALFFDDGEDLSLFRPADGLSG